ncbi:hypothetical protein AB0M29_28190 [Streptomyces sp. NPDC051976]|uniref:hypothetical protein n=1 Tax=Streptomyces sp. NPDC051976 TaxID=3154947 RepID=UPI00341DFB2C
MALSRADLRHIRRTGRWTRLAADHALRRLLAGRAAAGPGAGLQPSWLPRRLLTVLTGDVDTAAGAAAVWMMWRPGSAARRESHVELFERVGGEWVALGGGGGSAEGLPARRLPAGEPGQFGMVETHGGGGCAARLRPEDGPPPWIGYAELRVADEVDHLLIGDRRADVPADGLLVAVWILPSAVVGPAARPPITCVGRGGEVLSTLGPSAGMDSYAYDLVVAAGAGASDPRPTSGG